MACRITEFVLDCRDPELLARFWADVLGWVEVGRESDGAIDIGPEGAGDSHFTLLLSPSTDPRPAKLPLHLDVCATDRTQAEELERLLALGARPLDVGQGDDVSWHVLADPEGNEFCLLSRTVEP